MKPFGSGFEIAVAVNEDIMWVICGYVQFGVTLKLNLVLCGAPTTYCRIDLPSPVRISFFGFTPENGFRST